MSLIQPFYNLDIYVLRLINVQLASPTLDQFWLIITHMERLDWFKYGVLPLILVSLLYIYRASSLRLLLVLALGVALSDVLSYRVVKSLIDRPRPFQNSEISSWVRKVGDASGPSFPSNHAANCFAGAVILAWYFKSKRYFFYGFAGLVAISRVALGVHYPSDVLAGAMLGIVVGLLVRSWLLNHRPMFWLKVPVSKSDEDSGNWRRRIRRLYDL